MSLTDRRFVDSYFGSVPVWMTRPRGKAFLTAFMLFLDLCVTVLEESFYARMPGLGTPTALTLNGQMRGMIRGMSEGDTSFANRLITWLDRARAWGTQIGIARAVQDYVFGQPMVRVVNRAGVMTTLAHDGTITTNFSSGWDWDSVSNPERTHFGFWSELWIIVYVPPWPIAASDYPSWYWGTHELGLGLQIPRVDVDALRSQLSIVKSAHTFIRCVVFSYDATLFDPSSPSSMPDGKWGEPLLPGNPRRRGSRSRSCRFFEPENDPNNYHALRG